MITLTLKYETCLDLFTESMSGCVFSHTHTKKKHTNALGCSQGW